jgi:signal transduction histidine kinase
LLDQEALIRHDFTSHANPRDFCSRLGYTQDVPKIGQLSNCVAVAKDTIWQRLSVENAPATAALVFACALAGVTVWFTQGAVGAWLALASLVLALVALIAESTPARALLVTVFLAIGAFALILLSGGLAGAAACAILWPALGAATLSNRIGQGIGASFGALGALGLATALVELPTTASLSNQTGILALGACGAFTLAICVRLLRAAKKPNGPAQSELEEVLRSRDNALSEAKQARAQTQGRAQFMAEMSHEIRTPLNAILGFADTMRAGVFGPLPKAYHDYPDLIHSSGAHLLDLVSDLLDLSKIEAGRYETNLKPLRLDEMAFEGVRVSGGAASGAGVQIRHEAGGAVEIKADARAVRQIIYNLMSNAIKFTPKGGRVTLRVFAEPDGHMGCLEVEDSGVGIGEADLAKIGEPWNQSQSAQDNDAMKTRGSGLGLALVKRLTDLQAGQFSITSTLGVGTKVKVSFPLAQVPVTLTPPSST